MRMSDPPARVARPGAGDVGSRAMEPVVQLNRVSKRYRELEAVKELTLEVEEGEFLTLLGPSGCGKTTTLRLISGFEVADEGEVVIEGQVVNALPPFRRNVNTVFQNYALFPHMNVLDNVGYSLSIKRRPRNEIRSRVTGMLERVGLADKARNMPSELSGGQMQRVALARALINEPRLLLLDEPLGALDAKLRRAMQLELKHMQAHLGISFIYVTHDQEEALVMSDRVAVMDSGTLQQLGTPAEIFERPANPFVAEFLGTANFLEGAVKEAGPGRCCIELIDGTTIEAAEPPPLVTGEKVVATVRPQKIQVGLGEEHESTTVNTFPGTMKEVIFEGVLVRLLLESLGGTTLEVQGLPDALPFAYQDLVPGQRLTIHLPPEAVLVYPR